MRSPKSAKRDAVVVEGQPLGDGVSLNRLQIARAPCAVFNALCSRRRVRRPTRQAPRSDAAAGQADRRRGEPSWSASCSACSRPTAAPGTASRRWRRWSPTSSRRPTRWSTRWPAGDVDDHREELGDLLLQIVFQSELRFAEGKFGIDDVARGIVAKLVRRHPHVFGDVVAKDADEVLANWAKLKAAEKAEKGKHGALDGVPRERAGAAARHPRRREGGRGRLRLARRRRARAPRSTRSCASSTRPAAAATAREMQRRARRPAVRDREPGAQAGARRRAGAARRDRSLRAPLRPRRAGAGRRRGAPSPTPRPTSRTDCGKRRSAPEAARSKE